MALNEVIAYISLGAQKAALAPRSFIIATFALCGFANLSSIGIQIGGIGALVPERRNDLAKLGFRAMLAGTMANLISAGLFGDGAAAVEQVKRLDLRAKFIVEGFLAGLHDSPYRGFSLEFSEHRRGDRSRRTCGCFCLCCSRFQLKRAGSIMSAPVES